MKPLLAISGSSHAALDGVVFRLRGEMIVAIGARGRARPWRNDALRWVWTIPGKVSAQP